MAWPDPRRLHEIAGAREGSVLQGEGRDLAEMLRRRFRLVPAECGHHDGAIVAPDADLMHEEAAVGRRILIHEVAEAAIRLHMIDRDRLWLVASHQRVLAVARDREV